MTLPGPLCPKPGPVVGNQCDAERRQLLERIVELERMLEEDHAAHVASGHAAGVREGFASGLERAAKDVQTLDDARALLQEWVRHTANGTDPWQTDNRTRAFLSPTPPAAAPERCRSCPHPPHLGLCTKRNGGTAYACGCAAQTAPVSAATVERYECRCACGATFYSRHKRSVTCPECLTPPPSDAGTEGGR